MYLQVVELQDGSLLITARNQGHYHSRSRFMIKSYDAADSLQLQNVYIDKTLLDSAVQVRISASIIFLKWWTLKLAIN